MCMLFVFLVSNYHEIFQNDILRQQFIGATIVYTLDTFGYDTVTLSFLFSQAQRSHVQQAA